MSILRVTTPSPRWEGEEEGHPSGREGTWTKKVACRYFMNGFCKEGDNCHFSHGLSENPKAMACRDYLSDYVQEDYSKNKHKESHKVNPAAPNLHPPASLSLPPLADPLVKVIPGTVKPSNTSFATIGIGADDWVYAMEFVPGKPYNGCVPHTCAGTSQQGHMRDEIAGSQSMEEGPKNPAVGKCPSKEGPMYLHEDSCDLCGRKVPNTEDATPKLSHIKSCTEAHGDMELALTIQRSQHLVCGICMEVIYEKGNPNEVRFGILSNCNHTFCLKCIRKWRSAKQFESNIIKACPECRVTSTFVIPSEFWVEEREEKQQLIQKYKEAMRTKPCRYFDGGLGSCPFGSNCFYKHACIDRPREEQNRLTRAI